MIEEKALLVRPDVSNEEVRLDWVAIEKMLRRLYHPDVRVVEQRNAPPQKITMRHKIRIENRHEFGWVWIVAQHFQRVIDIARLSMGVIRPRQIMSAFLVAKRCEPRPAPVIEHIDADAWELYAQRADYAAC